MTKKVETTKSHFYPKVEQKSTPVEQVKVEQTKKPRPGSFAELISQ